jgi:hypothetical protein
MGRAVHYRVHALTGLASAKRNAEDESCLTFARSLIPRPAQAAKAYSARDSDHEDVRKLRWHARVGRQARSPSSFARGIRTAPPGSADRQRLVVGKALAKMQPHGCRRQPSKNSIPPASKCLSHVSGRLRGICDEWARARTVERILTISRAKRQCPTIVHLMPVPLKA